MEMDTENFKYFCTVCNDYFPHESLSIHNETERHVLVETFYSNRKLFNVINTDHPIRVTPDDFNFEDIAIKVNLNQEKTVKFNICNISNSSVTLLDIFGLTNEKHVQIVNIKKPTKPVVILKGGKLNNSFNAGVIINDYGFFEVPIAFTYSSSTDKSEPKISNFVLILDFEVETDWSVTLRPKRPYHMESKKSFLPVIKKIPGPEIKLVGNMMTIYLKMYKPPVEMVAILENKMKESKNLGIKALTLLHAMNKVLGHKENVIDFTRENYVDRFTYLLYMEEAEELIELEQFRKEKVYLKSVKENNISYFRLEVGDGLIEGRPSLIVGDKALIYPLRGKDYGLKNVWYSGLICKVELKSILLRFRKSFHQLFQPDVMKVNVKFEPQRLPYKMCYRALEFVKEREMQFLLFPLENFPFVKSPNFVDKLEFHNEDINNNPEQAQAVLNIVNCTSRPYPYLLFGPPGTGKTVTLVEAIIQNWKLEPENRRKQLVCASSNAAADIITERLLTKSEIPATDIFRMYSPSVKNSQISNVIMSCENAHNLNFNEMNNNYDVIFPSYEEVMGRNIVITTIITAGRLVDGIPCTHFSHVLIDESGHCMEPECLVPFMGLITGENKRVHGQLVLAGDPLQLGPVLRSPAKDYGLQKSLLERLMTSDSMYKKNPETEKYNELVLTKLHLNFRSHPAIIEIPNKLFYDRELKAAGKKEITETFCNWNELPTKQFPIIFHGIIGKEDREETSPSFFNLNEVNLIMHYIKECLVGKTINGRLIKTTDIGVVSPYKKQIQKLSIALKTKGLNGITLGSVEQFQGNEKLIIIVSTVRSMPKDEQTSLGFLKNPKEIFG
ncbi:putative helicase mov-10-B.1 isoform X2 [Lycorma delicatula]|uniref:putative helicase mov-10-B.1 isoform X2 n=2 Tax=Lycorma delicatula TaxID=130591 RepID=UPI003F517014